MLLRAEKFRVGRWQGALEKPRKIFLKKLFLKAAFIALCLFGTLFFGGGFGKVSGQTTRVYASNSARELCNILNGLTCNPIVIDNPEDAIGNNLQNYAQINLPLLLGSRYLELSFTNPIPAGTTIRIKVGYAPGLAGLLSNINFRAYRNTISVSPQYPASDLLSVLGGDNVQEIVLNPAITGPDFNRIRINFSSLLSLGGYFRVYAAYYLTTAGSVNCEGVKDVIYGSTAPLVGGLNPVEDSDLAIDGNAGTYANLRSNVSLLSDKTHVTALFDDLSRAGDSIRVVLRNPAGGLLDANLISQNLAITTYNDRSLAQPLALDASFLRLTLLGGAGNKYELTYPASAVFNRIEVSLGQGLLSALNNLEVYEISRTLTSPSILESDGKSLIICEGEQLTFEPSAVELGDQFFWYDENGDLLSGNVSDYTISQNLSPGIHQFRLGTQRSGCINQTKLSSIQVIVNPLPQEDDISIYPQGGTMGEGNKISYPVGSDVVIDPNIAAPFLGTGTFTWYKEGVQLDGLETDGGTFEVDENGRLTISNTTAAVEGYELSLEYESSSECKAIKDFLLYNFIILPSMVHTFNVQAKEGRQVKLVWELSNEQLEGSVMIQRASSNLEFTAIGSLPIDTGMEKIPMEFTDQHPLPGRNYYRLFIIKGTEGSDFYSEVRMAEIDSFDLPVFLVFPNSFVENFTVESTLDLDVPVVASLLNTNGVVIRQLRMDRLSYGELIEFRDLSNLPEGIYILRMETSRGSKAYRVIKQNDG